MIFRGRVAEVPSISTQESLLGGSEEYRERPALIDGPSGRTITYGDLAEAVRATSAGLVARGFRQGDVLALMSPNAPEYAIAILGVLSAGGIVTTLNPLYTVGEIVINWRTQARNTCSRLRRSSLKRLKLLPYTR
jgi:acyl-CoA synthetase (AMP-forming)/AMP-acid ligase II